MSAAYTSIQMFGLLFIMESNTINPDQTTPIGSSLIWVHVDAISATKLHLIQQMK